MSQVGHTTGWVSRAGHATGWCPTLGTQEVGVPRWARITLVSCVGHATCWCPALGTHAGVQRWARDRLMSQASVPRWARNMLVSRVGHATCWCPTLDTLYDGVPRWAHDTGAVLETFPQSSQDPCESRGGRPGLPVPIPNSPYTVSHVDVTEATLDLNHVPTATNKRTLLLNTAATDGTAKTIFVWSIIFDDCMKCYLPGPVEVR